MNVLLTSIGRRSYLAAYFQNALKGSGRVVATNSDSYAAGLQAGVKAIVVPPSHHPDYIDTLLTICVEEKIGLICSLHDLDLFILAKHQDRFRQLGALPVLPSPEWAETSLDKHACATALARHGFDVPWHTTSLSHALEALSSQRIRFPLVVKARHGFGSLGLNLSENVEDLHVHYRQAQRQVARSPLRDFIDIPPGDSVLIQECLAGDEYCLDIVNDLDGNYQTEFACQVHAMRSGESDSATTIDPAIFKDTGQRLSALVRCKGIMGVDLIVDSKGAKIIELNPRFTGDYPYQHLAGADVPAALIAWRRGDTVDRERVLSPQIGLRGYKDITPKLRLKDPTVRTSCDLMLASPAPR